MIASLVGVRLLIHRPLVAATAAGACGPPRAQRSGSRLHEKPDHTSNTGTRANLPLLNEAATDTGQKFPQSGSLYRQGWHGGTLHTRLLAGWDVHLSNHYAALPLQNHTIPINIRLADATHLWTGFAYCGKNTAIT